MCEGVEWGIECGDLCDGLWGGYCVVVVLLCDVDYLCMLFDCVCVGCVVVCD